MPGFTWVTEFPLFELNEETGVVESTYHPFTSPHPDDEHLLWDAINSKDPTKALNVRFALRSSHSRGRGRWINPYT